MTPGRLLSELESLARKLGIAVRAEPFGHSVGRERGGLCWVRGAPLIVLDDKLPLPDRIAILATALAGFDVRGLPVSPVVLDALEARRAKAGKRRRRALRPGLARARTRK